MAARRIPLVLGFAVQHRGGRLLKERERERERERLTAAEGVTGGRSNMPPPAGLGAAPLAGVFRGGGGRFAENSCGDRYTS